MVTSNKYPLYMHHISTTTIQTESEWNGIEHREYIYSFYDVQN